MIHRYRIQNFKSIIDVSVELSPVTVLVGKSGTGKSNFVQAIRLLRDVLSSPEQANALQQPWAQLQPATNKQNAPLELEVEFSIAGIEERFKYQLSLGTGGPMTLPLRERLDLGQKCLFHQVTDPNAGQRKWVVAPELVQVPEPGPIALGRIPAISEIVIAFTALASGIGCYVFSDRVLCGGVQRQSAIVGLDDEATNFLVSLKEIISNLQDLQVRKSMVGALQRVNPSVSSVELNDIRQPGYVVVGHKFNGKTVSLFLSQESDGFRRFYAHLLALYQRPSKQTLIFEHPEDGIHPGALSLLAEEFKAAPQYGRGQVILTTHSPKLLDQFDAEQIRVVELDGFATRIGGVSNEQREAIRDKLLDAGELLTVDPARIQREADRAMKRIVLFVEGEGESDAAPRLVKRILTAQNAWDSVSLDENTFRVGAVNKLAKDEYREWKRKIAATLKRPNVGGVLLLLDGDVKKVGGLIFCAANVAKSLATEAEAAGGGVVCSIAVVFARQEYESWLIAGVSSLAGKRLPDGRLIAPDAQAPAGDLEEGPRDAKGWFGRVIEGGYKPTRDQAALTDLVDLEAVRARNLRSFTRLESAVSELIAAIRSGKHVVTPTAAPAADSSPPRG